MNREHGDRMLLHEEIGSAQAGEQIALLLVDMDGFRAVNHSYGNAVGDGLLAALGARIRATARPGDETFGLGGDEFAVLLRAADAMSARAAGLRLLAELDRPFAIDGRRIYARARAGLALGRGGGRPEVLIREADASLYEAKRTRGAARLAVFDEARHRATLRALALSGELTAAVPDDELLVHYQPIVELASRRVIGREALVRWQHPERGLVSPGAFIALAEETGLIGDIGDWVLGEACREAAGWAHRDGSRPYVSVNVATQQLCDEDFPNRVAAVLAATGLAAAQLVVEITERAVADVDAVAAALDRLRRTGVRVFMDDFGTGYSSLGLIRSLPLDGVKLDRSFVAEITTSDQEWSLAVTIVRLVRDLGLATTAEGVESAAQLAQLRSLGCSHGQGFYLGRPGAEVPDA